MQDKQPVECPDADLAEDRQWFIEDMQDRRHGYQVHRASGVW